MVNYPRKITEIIEDSEPEREEKRRINLPQTSVQPQANEDVIELTDDSLSDKTFPAASAVISVETELSPSPAAVQDMLTVNDSSDSDQEPSAIKALKLGQFAFTSKAPIKRNFSASSAVAGPSRSPPAERERVADIPKSPKSKPRPIKRNTSHRFTSDFSDADIAKVLKCISCTVAWTVRKSAAQKMAHIQACAKKRSFTDETVKILIRKEIDLYASLPLKDKGKGKAKPLPADAAPKTFMENVVDDMNSKPKRSKAKNAEPPTVKPVVETRKDVLARAMEITGSGLSGPVAKPAGAFEPESEPPQATQAFGQSSLAQRLGTRGPLFSYDGDASNSESDGEAPPPMTQGFAPSKLGATVTRNSLFDLGGTNTKTSILATSSRFNQSSPPPKLPSLSSKSPSVNDHSQSPMTMKNIEEDDHNDSDNKFINPSLSDSDSSSAPSLFTQVRGKKTASRKSPSPTRSQKKSTTKTRSKSSRPKSPKVPKPIYDDEWEKNVRAQILADDDLHMKILRYEPIHFNIFVKLLTDEPPSLKLRMALRNFLDKQAVQFYGSETSGWK